MPPLGANLPRAGWSRSSGPALREVHGSAGLRVDGEVEDVRACVVPDGIELSTLDAGGVDVQIRVEDLLPALDRRRSRRRRPRLC